MCRIFIPDSRANSSKEQGSSIFSMMISLALCILFISSCDNVEFVKICLDNSFACKTTSKIKSLIWVSMEIFRKTPDNFCEGSINSLRIHLIFKPMVELLIKTAFSFFCNFSPNSPSTSRSLLSNLFKKGIDNSISRERLFHVCKF